MGQVTSDYNLFCQEVVAHTFDFTFNLVNNLTLAQWQVASGQDANSQMLTDLGFYDVANGFYFLNSQSPAIDAGTAIAGGPYLDFAQRYVPQGPGTDIGAMKMGAPSQMVNRGNLRGGTVVCRRRR